MALYGEKTIEREDGNRDNCAIPAERKRIKKKHCRLGRKRMWNRYVFFTTHIVQSPDPTSNLYSLQVCSFFIVFTIDFGYNML